MKIFLNITGKKIKINSGRTPYCQELKYEWVTFLLSYSITSLNPKLLLSTLKLPTQTFPNQVLRLFLLTIQKIAIIVVNIFG